MRRVSRHRVSYVITHSKEEHGHLLGINSLALDTTTLNPETGKSEGILYSAGRDGVIASWDLHLPFRKSGPKNKDAQNNRDNEVSEKVDDFKSNWEIDDEIDLSSQPPRKSTFRQSFRGHTDWVNDIILCHNNETLISASSDRTLKLWHPHKSNSPSTIGYHTDYIKVLSYAPGPGWVASGGFDRKIIIWDVTEFRPSFGISSINAVDQDHPKIEASPKSSIYALACDPLGTVLVSGSPEKIVRVWDPRSAKQITSFTGHTDNIRAVLVSDDGELILSGSSDTTIKLWSLRAQRCVNTFTIHSDSVWSLHSDHPRLETFYAGSKDGFVTRTDYSGRTEIRDGECVAVCKEDAGVVKLVALDNKFIWTATHDSSIRRWKDVSSRRGCKVRTPSTSPTLPPSSPIPSSAVIKLTSTGVTMDSEVATLHSFATDDMENLENDDPIPIRSEPDDILEGQHGLIKRIILNNRRHILTLDNSGEVALWDIILCIRVKTYGKRDIEEVASEINTIESIPNWCSVDTRIGILTVHLDENRCFDAEMYADDSKLMDEGDMREDQRINLGKVVLRNLFKSFTKAEIQAYEELQNVLTKQYGDQKRGDLQENRISQHISFPPATLHSGQLNNTETTSSPTTSPTTSTTHYITTALPPTTPQAAFTTGPFTAPATTDTSKADYFSGSHHNSPTSPTGASGSLTPPGTTGSESLGSLSTSELIKVPPPALVNQSQNSNATSFMGRIMNFSVRKNSRSSNADSKLDSGSLTSENYTGTKPSDLKLTVSTQHLEENDSNLRKDDDTTVNSPTGSISHLNKLQHVGGSSHSIQPIRQVHHLIQPPFSQYSLNETPEIHIPPHTTIIISEETPEASTYVDLYRGTVGSLDKDAETIEKKAPTWLIEFLIKNKISPKEPTKIGFILRPHEGSGLGDLPNGNSSRLTANRMLRARKILAYVVEKLDLDKNLSEIDIEEKDDKNETKSFIKPEMWLELVCQDQVLPPTMTLATIKSHIWKVGGDVIMTYRLRLKSI